MTLGTGVNEFKPFATGVGAAVQTPAEYDADPTRQQGFQNGIVFPDIWNMTLRQPSVIAAMIGQFVGDLSGSDALDDGDIISLEQKFIDALSWLAQTYGIYVITDTGTGSHIVGGNPLDKTAPTSYSQVRLVVIKKSNSNNAGAMDLNGWGLGAVTFRDNTGADFAADAIIANSFHIATFDGSGFRAIGGAATYTNVTSLTANSGDGITVAGDGKVNRRRAAGTHNTTVANGDRWARGASSNDADLHMTTLEYLAWLIGALKATVGEIQAASSDAKVITPAGLYGAAAPVTAADASTIVFDFSTAINFEVTINGNRGVAAPAGMKPGVTYFVAFIQGAGAPYVPSFNVAWDFGAAGVPSFSTTAGKKDILGVIATSATTCRVVGFSKG